MTIEGSIALVLGASSGPGITTVQRLATAGHRIYGTIRRGVQAGRPSFQLLPPDVTHDESVQEVVKPVVRQHGHIDVLLNNAGFGVAPAGAEESSIERAKAIPDTNFVGLVRMTRAVLPCMRRRAGVGKRLKEVLEGAGRPDVAAEIVSKPALAARPKFTTPPESPAGCDCRAGLRPSA
jgi:NAD(P)-dependent dehydrogenase (short-subunit alcohol dehydrogenase family)